MRHFLYQDILSNYGTLREIRAIIAKDEEVLIVKILLVNPRDEGYYHRLGAFFPPLGLSYISSVLKKAGHEVRIVDMNAVTYDYTKERFEDYDVVGVSSDTVRFPLAKKIAKLAKERGSTVVMGGTHPTFDVNNILRNSIADYVILGEGEMTFLELVESIKNRERYPNIDGLAYLKDGTVKIRPHRFVKDLDTIPFPDRDGLPLDKYLIKFDGKRATSMITSRGCPFDCEFCSASQFMGRLWRKRSVKSSIEELKILVRKYGYKSIIFFDDNFTLDPKRATEISEQILKNDLKISWWAFSRADELLGHEDMVEAMAKSGCKMLFIGFESANDEALKEFKKKLKSDVAFDVVRLLKKYNIDVFASFILGALSDTRETIARTVKFAKRLSSIGASIVQFSILTPYPGTRLFAKLKPLLLTNDWRLFDGTHLVFKHPNFTPKELRKEFVKAYFKVYTTPKLLFKRGLPYFWKLIRNRGYRFSNVLDGKMIERVSET